MCAVYNFNQGLEVVDEVKVLISRLEQDRQQTIRAYQREVERVKLLQIQVYKEERRRLYILPKAVELGNFPTKMEHSNVSITRFTSNMFAFCASNLSSC